MESKPTADTVAGSLRIPHGSCDFHGRLSWLTPNPPVSKRYYHVFSQAEIAPRPPWPGTSMTEVQQAYGSFFLMTRGGASRP